MVTHVMKRICTKLIAITFAIAIITPSYSPVAVAEIIGTESAFKAQSRDTMLTRTEKFFLQNVVAKQLSEMGIDREDILERIDVLTDEELATLSHKMEQMPAGAGVIEVIGIVFLVLLILELVGVTDIFKKI